MSVLDDFKKKGKTILEVKHIIKNESDTGAADKVTVWDLFSVKSPYDCLCASNILSTKTRKLLLYIYWLISIT